MINLHIRYREIIPVYDEPEFIFNGQFITVESAHSVIKWYRNRYFLVSYQMFKDTGVECF